MHLPTSYIVIQLSTIKFKIPLNSNNFFYISKNDNMGSIILLFDHTETINLENLYLIFQIYLNNKELLIRNIHVIAENELNFNCNKKLSIFHHIWEKKIDKMSFIDFQQWYETLYNDDMEYIKSYKYYGFQFVFFKISIGWQNGTVYPVYPWNLEYISKFIKKYEYINENVKLKKKIRKLKINNSKLKYFLRYLKK